MIVVFLRNKDKSAKKKETKERNSPSSTNGMTMTNILIYRNALRNDVGQDKGS